MMDERIPTLAVAFKPPSSHETTQRPAMQWHYGTHMDHLVELVEQSGPAAARQLQFGAGLLIAESVAMTAEITSLLDPAQEPVLRASLHHMLIDRLSRLPGIAQWGNADLPDSPTMHGATRAAHDEFLSLPTLAATYISGPFRLADQLFRHPLIPHRLRTALRTRWVEGTR